MVYSKDATILKKKYIFSVFYTIKQDEQSHYRKPVSTTEISHLRSI